MKVGELFQSVPFSGMYDELKRIWPDQRNNLDSYLNAFGEICSLEPKETKFVCQLKMVESEDGSWVDITGFDGTTAYAIEFVDWAEWIGMEIDNQTPYNDNETIAALIIFEMTFVGFSNKAIRSEFESILDSVEEIKKQFPENKDFTK